MSIAKSLPEPEHGHRHRIHRSTKGRKHKGKQHKLSLDYKRRIEQLRERDIE